MTLNGNAHSHCLDGGDGDDGVVHAVTLRYIGIVGLRRWSGDACEVDLHPTYVVSSL